MHRGCTLSQHHELGLPTLRMYTYHLYHMYTCLGSRLGTWITFGPLSSTNQIPDQTQRESSHLVHPLEVLSNHGCLQLWEEEETQWNPFATHI